MVEIFERNDKYIYTGRKMVVNGCSLLVQVALDVYSKFKNNGSLGLYPLFRTLDITSKANMSVSFLYFKPTYR